MTNVERWTRASEEMKFYDSQLKDISKTPLFLNMLKTKAPKIQDVKAQLFSPDKKEVSYVSSRRTKK